jgi:hypothetical protein
LFTLRARARFALQDLDQSEIDYLWANVTSETRKSLRKAINLIAELKRMDNVLPHIARLLPPAQLCVPASPDRARRIEWQDLPEPFRDDAEQIFQRALRKKSDLKALARAQLNAGCCPLEIDAEIAKMRAARKKAPKKR